jgi:hypothetical protein
MPTGGIRPGGGVLMKGRLGVVLVMLLAAIVLLAVTAPVVFAATWDIKKFNVIAGQVSTTSATTFTVTNKAGAKVGRVVKTASGAWNVVRGTTRIAVAKANGTKAYPVNLYTMKGTRIGRCGMRDGAWSMVRFSGVLRIIVGTAPKACPGRAAMGAARLLLWN